MLIRQIQTQFSVIYALSMREVHTIYGKTRLGYLWAIIRVAFGIAIMWFLRNLCHMAPPHGMNSLSFLVVGYVMWDILSDCMLKCISAIKSNITLLTFPQVSPIDIMIARCIVIVCTEIVSAIFILTFGYYLGYEFYITNIGGLLYILFLSTSMSFGLGMICSSLNSYFGFLERIIPLVFRFLMFASGVMFSVTPFVATFGEWLLWNPFLQIIEFTRSCVSHGYPSNFVSHIYLVYITVFALTLGFLLEKHARKRLMA